MSRSRRECASSKHGCCNSVTELWGHPAAPPQVGPSPSPCHPGSMEVGAVYSLIRRWVLSRGSADLGEREEGNSLPVLWSSQAHLTPLESNTPPAPGHRGHVQPDILSTCLCQVLRGNHRGFQHTPRFQRVSSLQVPINEGKTCKTSGEDQSLSSQEHPRRTSEPSLEEWGQPPRLGSRNLPLMHTNNASLLPRNPFQHWANGPDLTPCDDFLILSMLPLQGLTESGS